MATGVVSFVMLLLAGVVLMADRAPDLLLPIATDVVEWLWRILEGENAQNSSPPDTDFVVHIAMWTLLTLLVAVTVWSWRGLAATAVAMFAMSLVIEKAQGVFSAHRAVEFSDATGNALGVICGTIAAAACYLLYPMVARNRTARP